MNDDKYINMKVIASVKYVIQQHSAKRAGEHYDLRIKYPFKNLAASWALPKSHFPEKTGERVLAIRTHDHGRYWLYIDKLDIPPGEYGAGYIKTIQGGKALIYGWTNDHITFYINGRIATGRFSLIKFKSKERKTNTWVLIKTKLQPD